MTTVYDSADALLSKMAVDEPFSAVGICIRMRSVFGQKRCGISGECKQKSLRIAQARRICWGAPHSLVRRLNLVEPTRIKLKPRNQRFAAGACLGGFYAEPKLKFRDMRNGLADVISTCEPRTRTSLADRALQVFTELSN